MSDLLGSSFYAGLAGRNADQANANLRAAHDATARADRNARIAKDWQAKSKENNRKAEYWYAQCGTLENKLADTEARLQAMEARFKEFEMRAYRAEHRCSFIESQLAEAQKAVRGWREEALDHAAGADAMADFFIMLSRGESPARMFGKERYEGVWKLKRGERRAEWGITDEGDL